MWWFALRWIFAELPLLLRISLTVCLLWENFTNYFIITALHVLSRLKIDGIILKQSCCFTQVFAIDCDVMHTKWWRQIYPCSTKSAMGADDVINVQRCYPCSTRSAMSFWWRHQGFEDTKTSYYCRRTSHSLKANYSFPVNGHWSPQFNTCLFQRLLLKCLTSEA